MSCGREGLSSLLGLLPRIVLEIKRIQKYSNGNTCHFMFLADVTLMAYSIVKFIQLIFLFFFLSFPPKNGSDVHRSCIFKYLNLNSVYCSYFVLWAIGIDFHLSFSWAALMFCFSSFVLPITETRETPGGGTS